jgi:putative MFS transporter
VPWELTAVSTAGGRRAQLQHAAQITARIDRLPACRSTWMPVVLVSLAAIFELYDLFQTAYIPPGLVRDGIFRTGSQGFLGQSDQATFAAVTFFGLFLAAIGFSSIADRFGRRVSFVWALLAYSASTALLAIWRLTARGGCGSVRVRGLRAWGSWRCRPSIGGGGRHDSGGWFQIGCVPGESWGRPGVRG